ncbi:uncharacterized protein Tco025E_00397 [Trypanosoma conorhini]|uniref:Uncharacterized protein n=1 Tax=Trypanosoma conorhini TaxID=83891 RepID=A0A3R7LHF9_9TRYP|nr:uncharacterized protein Tco025E_00397 [Trypanosoma conorhini]RNF27327.1 hypothetical protein Tco025E_00397 [Trypanosoma conorhini]
MQLADTDHMRALAEEATREYADKRDAADKATREAEAMPRDASLGDDESSPTRKWERALQARKEASAAAVAAQQKLQQWAEAAAEAARGAPSRLGVAGALAAEAKRASAALVMGMIDVARERQDEVALLQRLREDALAQRALAGSGVVGTCTRDPLDTTALSERASVAQKRGSAQPTPLKKGRRPLGQQKARSRQNCCAVM